MPTSQTRVRLWRSFDELLGRGRPRPPDIDTTAIHRYLDDKVIGVHTATSGADPPFFTFCPTGCTLQDFYPVTPADVKALVRSVPIKQCSSDRQPTWQVKANADILSPFLCQLFNSCCEVYFSLKGYLFEISVYYQERNALLKTLKPVITLSESECGLMPKTEPRMQIYVKQSIDENIT